ncbi:hypothetical protein [Massilia sp.]|uniref:hypothetical protein n=1 Tax=Massilia sp. TaxID=1882437 RepID=UPI0028A7B1A9|nr:hypothetical protein [Massilia sp.]
MSATIYVTAETLATMTLIAPLDYYDRCLLSDDPATDPTRREGYYLKDLSFLSVSVLPDAAHIALQLNAGAAEVSFPTELRGCIFEGALHLPPDYQHIIAYWSGTPVNADQECAIYYQCPAQRYEVPLAQMEASSVSINDWVQPIDALVSEGVVVSIAGLGTLLSDAADDDFVSVALPIDEDLLGLDNGGFLAESEYNVTSGRVERIFLRVGDIRHSPDPQRVYIDILRYEELDYGFYY